MGKSVYLNEVCRMAMYPSLEDMKVDHLVQAQVSHLQASQQQQQAIQSALMPGGNNLGAMYPALTDYMGLELSQEMIALNMPEYSQIVPVRTYMIVLIYMIYLSSHYLNRWNS